LFPMKGVPCLVLLTWSAATVASIDLLVPEWSEWNKAAGLMTDPTEQECLAYLRKYAPPTDRMLFALFAMLCAAGSPFEIARWGGGGAMAQSTPHPPLFLTASLFALAGGGQVAAVELQHKVKLQAQEPMVFAAAMCGNEIAHVREWVEYHLSIGFSRLFVSVRMNVRSNTNHHGAFAPSTKAMLKKNHSTSLSTPEDGSIAVLEEYQEVTVIYPEMIDRAVLAGHFTGGGKQGSALAVAMAWRESRGRPAWIFGLDMDEYVMPLDPWTNLPNLLAHYDATTSGNLFLQKVWFGAGPTPRFVHCKVGPLIARFTSHGPKTAAGKSTFSMRTLPKPDLDQNNVSYFKEVMGVHKFDGLTAPLEMAPFVGPHGLVLAHYKPQSYGEFVDRFKWNMFQQNKFDDAKATFITTKQFGSGMTFAGALHRIPQLCRQNGSTFTKQLAACDMQHMCIDCAEAKQAHGCAEAETGAGGAAVEPSVYVRAASEVVVAGPHAPRVAAALASLDVWTVLDTERDVRGNGQRSNSLLPVVLTDPSDKKILCATPCSRLLLVDPTWDVNTTRSFIGTWLGKNWMSPKGMPPPRLKG